VQIQKQGLFDTQIEKVLPDIENDLRKKKYYLIDSKSAKNIRNKQVSYEVFDESNALRVFKDQTPFTDTLELDPLSPDLALDPETFQFFQPETSPEFLVG